MLRLSRCVAAGALSLITVAAGCSSLDKSPPPPRAVVPSPDGNPTMVAGPDIKPLPPQPTPEDLDRPPFDDTPLVNQHPPEQRAYVDAYANVGRPRIVVFVNRTLDGQVVPVNPNNPLATVDHRITSNGNVTIESHATRTDNNYYNTNTRDSSGKFQSNGPTDIRETTDIYLHPGQYDEAAAKSIDYEAIETILTDWLSANGKVAIVSPVMARQKLSDQEIKDLQNGRPQVLAEAARQLDADVIVQAQAHPTRQTERGLEIRMIVEAISIKGGESIARAVVDIPPPLDKPQINKYTRFLARKLMDGMTGSWAAFGGAPPVVNQAPPAPPAAPNPAPPSAPNPAPPAPSNTVPNTVPNSAPPDAPSQSPPALPSGPRPGYFAPPPPADAPPASAPAPAPAPPATAPSTRPASAPGLGDFGPG